MVQPTTVFIDMGMLRDNLAASQTRRIRWNSLGALHSAAAAQSPWLLESRCWSRYSQIFQAQATGLMV